MSLEIAWKQNILVADSNLLKSLLFVFGFGLQAFVCGFSRQNICSVCFKYETIETHANPSLTFILFSLAGVHANQSQSQDQPLLLLLLKPALKGQNVEPDLKMSVEKMVDV